MNKILKKFKTLSVIGFGGLLFYCFRCIGYEIHPSYSGYWTNFSALHKDFIELYKKSKERTGRKSFVSISRMNVIYQFLMYARTLPGEVAQVGVYRGGSAGFIAEIAHKKCHFFDTFEGLPAFTSSDKGVDSFKDTSVEMVREHLKAYDAVCYKGIFPATAGPIKDKTFCFVYLDADLYQSTKDGLEFFYPRLSRGGVIITDDLDNKHWQGVRKAVDEFNTAHGTVCMKLVTGQGVIIKA